MTNDAEVYGVVGAHSGEPVPGYGAAWFDVVGDDLEALGYAVGACVFPACAVGAPHIRQRLYFVADPQGEQLNRCWNERERRRKSTDHNFMGNTEQPGLERHGRDGDDRDEPRRHGEDAPRSVAEAGAVSRVEHATGEQMGLPGRTWERRATNGFWADADWLPCRDGKARAVEPGTFPLATSAAARMGRLRGYGNAINAEAAKEFIAAYLAHRQECPD